MIFRKRESGVGGCAVTVYLVTRLLICCRDSNVNNIFFFAVFVVLVVAVADVVVELAFELLSLPALP